MVMLEKGISGAMNANIIGNSDSNPVLVLAHGYGGDQSVWGKILPHLTTSHRVLVFDWSFSGAVLDQNMFDPEKYTCYDAFADDLIALVEEMDLASSPLVFIGHSMSGMVGCIASIIRPELFKSLILVGASPRYVNTKDYEGGFDAAQIEHLLANVESDYQNWAPNFASLVVDSNDPVSVDKFAKCLLKMKPEIAFHMAKIVFLCDERDLLEKITTPCTIIQMTKDIVVPGTVVDFMHEKIKGKSTVGIIEGESTVEIIKGKSTVEIIEGDGHFPQLTAHIKLLEVLDRVLAV